MKNLSAYTIASFIDEMLRINSVNSRHSRAYIIENALRKVAKSNGGSFSVKESNANPAMDYPDDPSGVVVKGMFLPHSNASFNYILG